MDRHVAGSERSAWWVVWLSGAADDGLVARDVPRFGDQPGEHMVTPESAYELAFHGVHREIAEMQEQERRWDEEHEAIGDWPPPVSEDDIGDIPPVAAANPDVEEAARDALAEVIAEPITDLVMCGIRLLEPSGVAAGDGIDKVSDVVTAIADPARIPAQVAEAVVSHLAAHLLGAAVFGPFGPVVAIYAGKFAGELTHQTLDGGKDTPRAQRAERAVTTIEAAAAFTDAQIGRLAESAPFRDYVSDLTGKSIAAILPADDTVTRDISAEPATGQARMVTAAVAAYEVRVPEDDPESVGVRPASLAILACILDQAVVGQWVSGMYQYLVLAGGTRIRRRIGRDGDPGPWTWVHR